MSRARTAAGSPACERLKRELRVFARWLRQRYPFDTRLEMRFVCVPVFTDVDGEEFYLEWWLSSLGESPFFAEIAVGSFAETREKQGDTWAYPTVIAAAGRVLKYYYQATMGSPAREDFAEAWGDKLLAAYVGDATPPKPWRSARLEANERGEARWAL